MSLKFILKNVEILWTATGIFIWGQAPNKYPAGAQMEPLGSF